VGADSEAVIRRFYELVEAGDAACWELWDSEAVSVLPPQWPEEVEARGIAAIERGWASWRTAFGEAWWEGIKVEEITKLADGRVLVDIAFDLKGGSSGAPVHQRGAAVYTVRKAKIVRAEHFMDRAEALAAAGVE
jgi:ketosteroid isomerase-like protein